jgi:hypothetical protein
LLKQERQGGAFRERSVFQNNPGCVNGRGRGLSCPLIQPFRAGYQQYGNIKFNWQE